MWGGLRLGVSGGVALSALHKDPDPPTPATGPPVCCPPPSPPTHPPRRPATRPPPPTPRLCLVSLRQPSRIAGEHLCPGSNRRGDRHQDLAQRTQAARQGEAVGGHLPQHRAKAGRARAPHRRGATHTLVASGMARLVAAKLMGVESCVELRFEVVPVDDDFSGFRDSGKSVTCVAARTPVEGGAPAAPSLGAVMPTPEGGV